FFNPRVGRRPGECRLGSSHDRSDSVALLQQALQMIEKNAPAGLADVEQAYRLAREVVESRRRVGNNPRSFVERIHKCYWHFASSNFRLPILGLRLEVNRSGPI